MQVTKKPVSELKKLEKNVRRHTPKQLTEYVRSVKMFGQIKPIVCDEDGTILAGNGLYDALVELGWETADCYVMTGLSEHDKTKLMLADNRVYELGITDIDTFEDLIRSLDGDIDVPGWDEDLLSMMNSSVQDVDEIVSSYGSFDPENVERINSRQIAPVQQEQPLQPLQQPQVAPQPLPQANTYPAEQPTAEPVAVESERYIICPHCGGRVCL